jgi:hypothetical protein
MKPSAFYLKFTVFGAFAFTHAHAADAPKNCPAPQVQISTPALTGTPVESDEATPLVLAPNGNDGSLLAWKENGSQRIQVGALSRDDKTFKKLYDMVADEVHAVSAQQDGGALIAMRNDPSIYSPKYCYSNSTPDKAKCGKLDLVRFSASGSTLFTSTLTDKTNVDQDGALFIWWYGHTARMGYDEKNNRYMIYFRSAGSSPRPNSTREIDIHAGDTLRLVDAATGKRLSSGWDWGCSHSWSVRLALSGDHWGAICHGDGYPNAMSAKQLDKNGKVLSTTDWLENTDPAQRALGGLVSVPEGFWLSYIDSSNGNLRLHLAKFDLQGKKIIDQIIPEANNLDSVYPFRPYLAKRGNDLLLGWKNNGKLVLATASLNTGSLTSQVVTTSSEIDNFSEFVSLNNGDVAWAHARQDGKVTVSRVPACQ